MLKSGLNKTIFRSFCEHMQFDFGNIGIRIIGPPIIRSWAKGPNSF